ncbi:ABC transporter ATP-binding protein [Acidisphaera sp. L21]|uniref:ABC transporter ATP-binding protein n=1 Tax=Acidisphaera sp. L21 TaxID=1641851 RepID=UPI00131C3DEB|nr:ABC transporter ATP-binding protein [Acidisphaera sp. L21]
MEQASTDTVTGRSLLLDRITHRYAGQTAVGNVTLDIGGGELVALLGPSGCGKTTLLRIVAGFVQQTAGQVVVGGTPVDHLPPNRRAVGIVFQNYALFPHMTIADNVAYGLAARGVDRTTQKAEAMRMLELVQLAHLATRLPRALSGGQQQRVALARALAVKPSILLLDEPFSALDKNLRLDMQIEVKRIQRLAGVTTILVTHDQEEALSMADRVAVLSAGKLEQFAPPTQVYDTPASLFVNGFVGQANMLPGTLVSPTAATLDIGGTIPVRHCAAGTGSRVTICIRPEHLQLDDATTGIPATVGLGLPLGPTIVHELRFADGSTAKVIEPRTPGAAPRPAGTAVHVTIAPDLANAFALS